MTSAQVLEVFRKCGALLHGHFILRSGLHSRTFFQCALVLQDPVATSELCGALVEKVKVDKWVFHSVISPAMGMAAAAVNHAGRRKPGGRRAAGGAAPRSALRA